MSRLRHVARCLATVLTIAIMGYSASVAAQDAESPEAETILEILEAGSSAPVTFAEEFANAVPVEEVDRVIAQVVETMGAPQSIEPRAEGYEVRSGTHKIEVRISINDAGEVDGLFFSPLVAIGMSVEDAAASLTSIEGETSLLVLHNGESVVSHNADAGLAVGSAFKLGVLSVLNAQIEAGEHNWDDVVVLEERHRSLPSGHLQSFPAGSPVTLHTAAALMISESDNTATDLLMDTVGRDAVNDVFDQVVLTTRELFQLKADSALQEEFLEADDAGKQQLLDGLSEVPPPAVSATSGPYPEGLGWQVPAPQLCSLITPLAGLDLFRINSGIASDEDWQQVAFKGGTLPGLINLTTALQDGDGNEYCVVYTLNQDQTVNEQEVFSAYAVLLSALKEAGGG